MIAAIVLAAGESKRFPGNKLLFHIEKETTIIEYLIRSILSSKVDHTIVVSGYEEEKIIPIVKMLNNGTISITRNCNYKKGGMSSSVKKGLQFALTQLHTTVKAVIITPGDIPFIPSEVFDQLIDLFYSKKSKIIIPMYKTKKGHPILFSSELFTDILKISEKEEGLKEILKKHINEKVYLPTNHPEILKDVDKTEDIRKFYYDNLET